MCDSKTFIRVPPPKLDAQLKELAEKEASAIECHVTVQKGDRGELVKCVQALIARVRNDAIEETARELEHETRGEVTVRPRMIVKWIRRRKN